MLIEQKLAQKPYAKPYYYNFNIRNTVEEHEWNYLSKFTKSKLNTFNHGLKGVMAQTSLRPAFIINNNMQAKQSNRHLIFSIDEALHVLKDINKQALNTIPIDYEEFMNLPLFDDMTKEPQEFYIRDKDLYQKRYYTMTYCQEIFEGYKAIELFKDAGQFQRVFQRICDFTHRSEDNRNEERQN